jgi:hypothetical protein
MVKCFQNVQKMRIEMSKQNPTTRAGGTGFSGVDKSQLVTQSPVQSGFSSKFGETETETGLLKFEKVKRLDQTDLDRSYAVFFRSQDRSKPVSVKTGL